MNFNEVLNNYIDDFDCSSKELVKASGMSAAVISRYRNGERVPNLNSNQLEQLSEGLYKIALNKGIDISKEDILANLSKTLKEKNIDFDQLRENLNSLIALRWISFTCTDS